MTDSFCVTHQEYFIHCSYIERFLCLQCRTFFSKIETRLQQHNILNMKQAETFPRHRSSLHSRIDFTTKLSISAGCHSEAHWQKAPKNSAVGRGNFFFSLSRLRVFMHQHHCQDDDWGCINKHPHAHFHHNDSVQHWRAAPRFPSASLTTSWSLPILIHNNKLQKLKVLPSVFV